MKQEHSHIKEVESYFNNHALCWSHHYNKADNGSMLYRIDWFLNELKKLLKSSASILDFGCGTADITRALANEEFIVTGCDISSKMIQACQNYPAKENLKFVQLNSEDSFSLPFAPESFDAVISSSVFEYLKNPEKQFFKIREVLKVGGHLLITIPDMRHPLRSREKWKVLLTRVRLIQFLLKQSRFHNYFEYLRLSINRFDIEEWVMLLEKVGFTTSKIPSCQSPLVLLKAIKK